MIFGLLLTLLSSTAFEAASHFLPSAKTFLRNGEKPTPEDVWLPSTPHVTQIIADFITDKFGAFLDANLQNGTRRRRKPVKIYDLCCGLSIAESTARLILNYLNTFFCCFAFVMLIVVMALAATKGKQQA